MARRSGWTTGLLLALTLAAAGGRAAPAAPGLVWVEGGTFRNKKSNYYGKPEDPHYYVSRMLALRGFYIARYEVTQREWVATMGNNPAKFRGEDRPVESVSWYDCIEYCNRRSVQEGRQPYYTIDRTTKDPGNRDEMDPLKWRVTINAGANGYRLPTEAEWEYAAGGGQATQSRTYAGSDDIDAVAWYWSNAGDRPLTGAWTWAALAANHNGTKPVGLKAANELGLYDMSGNVREWCWNWYAEATSNGTGPETGAAGRVWRGGGWMGGDFCCATTYRGGFEPSGKGPDQGFRVCRDR